MAGGPSKVNAQKCGAVFFSFVFEKGPFCINKGQHDENNTCIYSL